MPRPMTEQERQAFLAQPTPAVLSVVRDNGRPPLAVPVWYCYHNGVFYFFTGIGGRKSHKDRLIEKAGVLTLNVQHPEVPYKYVTVEGTVVRVDQPPSAEKMLLVASRYLPQDLAQGFVEAELANPGSQLRLYTVRPDRWLTADFTDG